METTSQTLGLIGEEIAFQFLKANGYRVLLRNYKTPLGEIDLVAKDRGTLVFLEVKTRASEAMGTPAESVTRHKQQQVIRNAKYYLNRYGLQDEQCRFDVVSVFIKDGQQTQVEVIRDAFGEEG